MKMIAIKKGNKTTYKFVPDDYVEEEGETKDIPQRDLTTTDCNQLYFEMSKEDFEKIFRSI